MIAISKKWCGHFDSTPDDERLLLAEDWARYIRSFVTDGIRNGGLCLYVTADVGMNVKIDTGIANIQGYVIWLEEDHNGRYTQVPVEAANPSQPRIDRLILRLDRTIATRDIVPMILVGAAGATPVPPALIRNDNYYDLSLAQIRVNAGALQIYDSNITDERFNQDLCGIMHSILGLDSASWQLEFDNFLISLRQEWDNWINTDVETIFQDFENSLNDKNNQWINWFSHVQTNLQQYTSFNFDYLMNLPGVKRVTNMESPEEIVSEIRFTSNDQIVAKRITKLESDGSVSVNEIVYDEDGTTELRNTVKTAAISSGGEFTEVIV